MSQFNLTISPSQLESVSRPNSVVTQVYQVKNNSDTSLSLVASVQGWTPLGDRGSVTYCQPPSSSTPPACPASYAYIQYSLMNADLKLGQPFTLLPHTSRQLVLKIKPSSEAPLGDYYSTLFITQLPSNSKSNDLQSLPLGRIGSHLLFSLANSDSPTPQVTVSQFVITPRFKDLFYPTLKINLTLNNQGDYFYAPSGHLTITKNNLEITRMSIAPQNVLSRHSRTLSCLSPAPDTNIIPCQLKPPFWPGRYTVSLKFDDNSLPPVSTSFFVFPYTLTFILLFSIVIYLITLRFFRRS